MSKGPQARERITGILLKHFERVDDKFLDKHGHLEVTKLPSDCDVFGWAPIAHATGFASERHLFKYVIRDPENPIHIRWVVLPDPETDEVVLRLPASAVNSLQAGAQMWQSIVRDRRLSALGMSNVNLGGTTQAPPYKSGGEHEWISRPPTLGTSPHHPK